MSRKAAVIIIISALLEINIVVFTAILLDKIESMSELMKTIILIMSGLLIVGSILALIFVQSGRRPHNKSK
jgi:hypothetical protein